jgi:hypothetical protein
LLAAGIIGEVHQPATDQSASLRESAEEIVTVAEFIPDHAALDMERVANSARILSGVAHSKEKPANESNCRL